MRTAAIRQELLNGTQEDLQRRRKIMGLSALGLLDFAFISLYQAGVIWSNKETTGTAFCGIRLQ